jgi:hypothetical protein
MPNTCATSAACTRSRCVGKVVGAQPGASKFSLANHWNRQSSYRGAIGRRSRRTVERIGRRSARCSFTGAIEGRPRWVSRRSNCGDSGLSLASTLARMACRGGLGHAGFRREITQPNDLRLLVATHGIGLLERASVRSAAVYWMSGPLTRALKRLFQQPASCSDTFGIRRLPRLATTNLVMCHRGER